MSLLHKFNAAWASGVHFSKPLKKNNLVFHYLNRIRDTTTIHGGIPIIASINPQKMPSSIISNKEITQLFVPVCDRKKEQFDHDPLIHSLSSISTISLVHNAGFDKNDITDHQIVTCGHLIDEELANYFDYVEFWVFTSKLAFPEYDHSSVYPVITPIPLKLSQFSKEKDLMALKLDLARIGKSNSNINCNEWNEWENKFKIDEIEGVGSCTISPYELPKTITLNDDIRGAIYGFASGNVSYEFCGGNYVERQFESPSLLWKSIGDNYSKKADSGSAMFVFSSDIPEFGAYDDSSDKIICCGVIRGGHAEFVSNLVVPRTSTCDISDIQQLLGYTNQTEVKCNKGDMVTISDQYGALKCWCIAEENIPNNYIVCSYDEYLMNHCSDKDDVVFDDVDILLDNIETPQQILEEKKKRNTSDPERAKLYEEIKRQIIDAQNNKYYDPNYMTLVARSYEFLDDKQFNSDLIKKQNLINLTNDIYRKLDKIDVDVMNKKVFSTYMTLKYIRFELLQLDTKQIQNIVDTALADQSVKEFIQYYYHTAV